ncbi:TasA family protein [Virgibacillus proomii]|uniref:TasA family protein n=1 Tax=Virgibacillus proomii TaxID=84407 RepID=UPI001C0FC8F5|nr:TasA family protein [Virgibacillus proomii]MBU5267156.1 M73 family metallopeptidase [Virgibacillus proomii]
MKLKKKLGMGIATAVLGIGLIGGGTFAYFSDQEVVENSFAAGTLDLGVNPTIAFNVDNLKPGDYMTRSFKMTNEGTLDIGKVLMNTSFSGTEGFEDHLRVDFLLSDGKVIESLSGKTVAELSEIKDQDITPGFWTWWPIVREGKGIPLGTEDTIKIKVTFVDNGQDQNHLQGANLNVNFTLDALQTEGEAR